MRICGLVVRAGGCGIAYPDLIVAVHPSGYVSIGSYGELSR
jgi:hypothetical protein